MKHIILILTALLLFGRDSYCQQTIEITGKVIDESGNNLKDVTVRIEGTANNITTTYGKFVLKVNKPAGITVHIDFSKAGYWDTTIEYTIKIQSKDDEIANRLKNVVLKKKNSQKKVTTTIPVLPPEIKKPSEYNAKIKKKIIITGIVLDDKGAYLDDVTVKIYGIECKTDAWGYYQLSLDEKFGGGSPVLIEFMKTGYQPYNIRNYDILKHLNEELFIHKLDTIHLIKLPAVSKGNMFGFSLETATVIGDASDEKEAQDFPLGTGIGATLHFQHFLKNTDLAYTARVGFLKWISQGTITATGAQFNGKLNMFPMLIGLKYYKQHFYFGLEAGYYLISKKGDVIRPGMDQSFTVPDTLSYSYGSCVNFGFSPCIGYKWQIDEKKIIDISVNISEICYSRQNINFIGLRASYNLFFPKK